MDILTKCETVMARYLASAAHIKTLLCHVSVYLGAKQRPHGLRASIFAKSLFTLSQFTDTLWSPDRYAYNCLFEQLTGIQNITELLQLQPTYRRSHNAHRAPPRGGSKGGGGTWVIPLPPWGLGHHRPSTSRGTTELPRDTTYLSLVRATTGLPGAPPA